MYSIIRANLANKATFASSSVFKLFEITKRSTSSKPSSDYYGKRLKGKVALTTASTTGIGLTTARRYAAEGANVVISSRKSENVEKAVEDLKEEGYDVLGVTCHVSKEEERQKLVEATIDKYGGIDIFLHNAGVNPIPKELPKWNASGILEVSESAWDKIFEVNLRNAWQMTKLVAPHMRKRETGSIIYVGSVSAFNLQIAPQIIHAYGVSKLALLGLTKACAIQLAEDNIRVNSICPGPTGTAFIQAFMENEEYMKEILAIPLLTRVGESGDISGVAAFLSSDDAKFITGENIIVAGGAQTRL